MTERDTSNKLSNMKKISAREFLHGFGKLHNSLEPGQSVLITKNGKPLGRFVKEPQRGLKLPDFRKDALADGSSTEIGDRLLKKLLADEAIS